MKKNTILIILFILLCNLSFSQSPKPTCRYTVIVPKAYFYDMVEVESANESYYDSKKAKQFMYVKRKAYLQYGDSINIYCKEGDMKWIYVEFKSKKGLITKGYIARKDLNDGEFF